MLTRPPLSPLRSPLCNVYVPVDGKAISKRASGIDDDGPAMKSEAEMEAEITEVNRQVSGTTDASLVV